METETAFDIDIPGYSVHQLGLKDSGRIQGLLEKCRDFMLLVDGRPAGPDAGEEEFIDVPPGRSLDDKFVFGITSQQSDLVGVLDVLRRYPDETTWWIGLLLFAPEVRSQGIGKKTVQGFADYVQANGGQAIMLGVVEENKLALNFWNQIGFEFVRKTEPRHFGDKIHAVTIMRKRLPMVA